MIQLGFDKEPKIHDRMASIVNKIVWIRGLLKDNQAAIQIVANPIFHERTKHIEKIIETKFTRFEEELADIMTN